MERVTPGSTTQVETSEEMFDRHMKRRGGRFNREPVDPAYFTDMMFQAERKLAEQFLLMARKLGSDIHFDFVQNNLLNAVAFSDSQTGREFIGMNAATVFMLRQIFYVLLCQPTILPQVGDPSKEIQSEGPFLAATELELGENEFRFPNDDQRAIFATTLAQLSFWHLIAHEHAHHSHGHVSFLNSRLGEQFLFEINESASPSDPDYILMRQTLEYDADCAAVQQSLRTVLETSKGHASGALDGRWDNAYAGQEIGLYSWGFAITILFRLMGRDERFDQDIKSAYHPPPQMRQAISLITANHVLGVWGYKELQERFTLICYKAQLDAEDGFAAITGIPRNKDLLRKTFDNLALESTSYLATLNQKWADLYPELRRHARVSIHDPSTDGDLGAPSV